MAADAGASIAAIGDSPRGGDVAVDAEDDSSEGRDAGDGADGDGEDGKICEAFAGVWRAPADAVAFVGAGAGRDPVDPAAEGRCCGDGVSGECGCCPPAHVLAAAACRRNGDGPRDGGAA